MENRRGEKPPTHVTGEDNFIIHSRKVFFFFVFFWFCYSAQYAGFNLNLSLRMNRKVHK